MTHAELKELIDDNLPFTLHVADDREIAVPHQDFIFLPPRSTVVIVAKPSPENPDEETVTNTIPLTMVSGVTQIKPADQIG